MIAVIMCGGMLYGQVSISTSPQTYAQDFNTLSKTSTSFINNNTVQGWYISSPGLLVDDGSANGNSCYNYATSNSSDRSIGALSTSTTHRFGARFKNNTGAIITSITISYTGEQWRKNVLTNTLAFDYRISSTTYSNWLTDGSFTANTALDFTSPNIGTSPDQALDGNATENRAAKTATLSVNIPSGSELFIRWTKSGTNSHGLSVDDLSIVFGNQPSLTVSKTSLTAMDYVLNNGPSNPSKTFTIAGSNLNPSSAGNRYVFIEPTESNFEFSLNNTDFYTVGEIIEFPTGNGFSATTVYTRLKAGLPIGNYTDATTISYYNASTPDLVKTINLSGAVTAPPQPAISLGTFTVTTMNYPLGAGPSPSKNANISGTNLTNPITVTTNDTAQWEVSKDNSTWSNSVTYPLSGSTIGTGNKIYVRLKAGLAVATYTGALTATSTGATPLTFALSGQVLQPNVTVSPESLTQFTYAEGQGPSVHQSITVAGANLASNITVTVPNASWEISTDAGFTAPSPTITLLKNASNGVATNNIHIRLKAGLPQGAYLNTNGLIIASSNAATQNKNLDGVVTGPNAELIVRGVYSSGTLSNIISNGDNTPSSLDNTLFAAQNIGSPQTKTFRLQNIGGLELTVNSIVLSNTTDFTITAAPPYEINSGTFKDFDITFAPMSLGTRTSLVTIANSDQTDNPYTFIIEGKGNNAEISIAGNGTDIANGNTAISATDYTFIGNANINAANPTAVSKVFVVTNSGNISLNITGITITGADASQFTVSPTTSSIAAGATGNIAVTFAPTSIGIKNAVISIANNDLTDNEGTYTFAIQGNASSFIACSQGEAIIYQTGFEEATFTTQANYQDTVYDGPSSEQWKTYYGTPSTASPALTDNKWIQMRLYSNGYVGYTQTEFDLQNVTKVTFRAKTANAELDIQVSFSTDGGITFVNPQTYDVTPTPSEYSNPPVLTYIVSPEGIYQNVRIRFTVSGTAPSSSNKQISLDDIVVYGGININKTWNGTAWSGDGLPPTASQKVIIDGDLTLSNTTLEGCECQVNAGKTLTAGNETGTTPATINIQSKIVVNGTLNIENNSSLVQHNDLATYTGVNLSMKRISQLMIQNDYTYWSSPVQNYILKDISPTTSASKFFKWKEDTQAWFSLPSTSNHIMEAGRGYIIRAPGSYGTTTGQSTIANFIGKPNNGTVTMPVNGSSPELTVDNKWILIGNPYPSAINADRFLSQNMIPGSEIVAGTIYFWTHNTPLNPIPGFGYTPNDYAAYNGVGSVDTKPAFNSGVSNSKPSGFIAAGQAFFIMGVRPSTEDCDITFNNSMRIAALNAAGNNNSQFFRTAAETAETPTTIEKHRVWLNLTGAQNAFNQTLVGYVTDATNAYDLRFDGESFGGNKVTFYSVLDTKNLVIQGRALPFTDLDIVPLGYNTTLTGNLTISIDQVDGLMETQGIYLQDNLLNVVHDLKASNYTFATVPGTFDSRFVLRYSPQEDLSNPTFNDQVKAVKIYKNKTALYANSPYEEIATVAVYDIAGRLIFEERNCNTNRFETTKINAGNQALIIKVTLSNGAVITQKVL